MRAHFDYDPKNDKMNPCPEAGLSFKSGEVLQIVDQEDPDWWQVSDLLSSLLSLLLLLC